ncbi:MAG: zf-TFIIB domain-containing protein [Deltaproteobacteria bacterium]|jgi:Zn-finger nucleic acid-binding protein
MIVDCPGCSARYDVSGRPPGTSGRCRCGVTFTLPHPPEAADTMQCPQCGAATNSTQSACAHCDSPLAVVRCPRCFGGMFAGARHCQHCGVRVEAPAVRHLKSEREESWPCPRCKTSELESLLAGEVLIDHCTQCGGLWLDHTVFERMQENESLSAPAMLSLAELPKPSQDVAQHGYIPCPQCEKLMTPKNYARRSGVIIDLCKAHGAWFDAGELPAIVEFIRGGGLEESRRRELEDLEAKKRMARIDAAMAQQQAMRSGAGRYDYYDRGELSLENGIVNLVVSLFRL